jgi:hypothetical protein
MKRTSPIFAAIILCLQLITVAFYLTFLNEEGPGINLSGNEALITIIVSVLCFFGFIYIYHFLLENKKDKLTLLNGVFTIFTTIMLYWVLSGRHKTNFREGDYDAGGLQLTSMAFLWVATTFLVYPKKNAPIFIFYNIGVFLASFSQLVVYGIFLNGFAAEAWIYSAPGLIAPLAGIFILTKIHNKAREINSRA